MLLESLNIPLTQSALISKNMAATYHPFAVLMFEGTDFTDSKTVTANFTNLPAVILPHDNQELEISTDRYV